VFSLIVDILTNSGYQWQEHLGYNIPLEEAAELWTASIQESNNADRKAGVPYLDSNSKDYFVDDIVPVEVSRNGGLGIELLELAGGRDDVIGFTVVSAVTKGGNAERAVIISTDSIARITMYERETSNNLGRSSGLVEEAKSRVRDCEAREFDDTIDALVNFSGDDEDKLYPQESVVGQRFRCKSNTHHLNAPRDLTL